MKTPGSTPDEIIDNCPEERKAALRQLRQTILDNIPKGFEECISYGMIGYSVPHSIYPDGYHCDPKIALPFVSFASQKNFIAFYHMGMYADPTLLDWFTNEYKKRVPSKLDMGKSCVRFKKVEQIPFELIGELMGKISVAEWIATYEKNYKRK